ncbi:hypothetical protein F4678DRAFT_466278 [Xylaria arbuscula]|nr:hypothetical protein F4678DRAFT_466278 [Xylaria arbuscula]
MAPACAGLWQPSCLLSSVPYCIGLCIGVELVSVGFALRLWFGGELYDPSNDVDERRRGQDIARATRGCDSAHSAAALYLTPKTARSILRQHRIRANGSPGAEMAVLGAADSSRQLTP